jgi:hypothetical protein
MPKWTNDIPTQWHGGKATFNWISLDQRVAPDFIACMNPKGNIVIVELLHEPNARIKQLFIL